MRKLQWIHNNSGTYIPVGRFTHIYHVILACFLFICFIIRLSSLEVRETTVLHYFVICRPFYIVSIFIVCVFILSSVYDVLSGCRLSGCRLSGCRLSGCRLSGYRLSGCRLSGCRLSWCRLSGYRLSGCRLSGRRLSGCRLSGCRLTRFIGKKIIPVCRPTKLEGSATDTANQTVSELI